MSALNESIESDASLLDADNGPFENSNDSERRRN